VTVEVWYPLGVAGAGASFAASGWAALRARTRDAHLAAAAAGALGAVVALDLVPDVRADAAAAGVPGAALLGAGAVTLVALWVAGRRRATRRSTAPGGLLGPAFLVHGFLEGVAGGTVIGWQAGVGLGLVLALVLHKAAEGADLAAALRVGAAAATEGRRRAWLLGGAAAPLLGCAAALVLPLPDRLGVVLMTVVGCVLARAAVRLLRRAAGQTAAVPLGVATLAGAAAMAGVIALA